MCVCVRVCVCVCVCVCVPLRAFLVYFLNRHQHNVTFRFSEKEVGKVIKFKYTGLHLQ